MYRLDEIMQSIFSRISVVNGKFRIRYSLPHVERTRKFLLKTADVLIGLIRDVDKYWRFEIEPSPRNLGSLIELLRCCTFRYDQKNPDDIEIVPDLTLSRNLGAFDTPVPVVKFITSTIVREISRPGKLPKILDPACGAGYFLLDTLDCLHDVYPEISPVDLVRECLMGMDIDQVAVALTRRNIAWHLEKFYATQTDIDLSKDMILWTDALADLKKFPIGKNSVDAVIGNPPYQFFSGRGSPVAALYRAGKPKYASRLKEEIESLAQRFKESSAGCRDKYKWFIQRSVELIKPGGYLGFITPNTWIAYPRYKDIRTLLSRHGNIVSVLNLGRYPFKRAHVPTAILIWKASEQNGAFPIAQISQTEWQSACDDEKVLVKSLESAGQFVINHDDDIEPEKSVGMAEIKSKFIKTLGEIAVIREGSHDIKAVDKTCRTSPANSETFPVLVDKTMGSLLPPDLGYIKPPDRMGPAANHTGERFLIRKTGDRLVIAPSPTEDFALAHQNVYVGKIKDNAISYLTLLGILASDLLTDIYRASAGGQHKRPHAQLRILFLKQLPIVAIPADEIPTAPVTEDEIDSLTCFILYNEPDAGRNDPISRRIAVCHSAIAMITSEIIESRDTGLLETLNKLVRYLYKLAGYNE